MLIYFLILNSFSFLLMRADKYKARKNEWRIPESRLWFAAFMGGAFGIYVGMKYYRHKTKHHLFKYGVPFVCIMNLLLYKLLTDLGL
ncbi:DUF1294 domain-containing protein [Bacillus taeanensis]|uniref:DUF1294 domain-containing protein n=1 Tax=Bacillus taeanensis TaxID=273032 RepID=A0A366Y0B9_9BACI|nr:DUF1294 domain-containing protein [Bacillus taeanensis]